MDKDIKHEPHSKPFTCNKNEYLKIGFTINREGLAVDRYVASISIGEFSAKRECTNTHQAYNIMIEVKIKLLQLRFRVYKTE
jgi:hypothetical protein